ncbi:MAG TPA: insulinase family protein [Myxococcales bacterium]|jgi:zinc protease
MKTRIVLVALAIACAHEKAPPAAPSAAGAAPASTVQQASSAAAQGTPQGTASAQSAGASQPATAGTTGAGQAPSAEASTPAGTAGPSASPGAANTASPASGPTATAPSGGTSTAVQSAGGVAKAEPQGQPAAPMMPEEAFRDQEPKAFSSQPRFQAPKPVVRKLKNGARVLVVENHSVPLVAVDIRFLHGIDADPHDKAGLAGFVADTVDEGTDSRPAEKLAAEIEDLAAHISAGAGLESTSAHLNCLTETLPQALEIFADIVQHPAFRKDDVERVRVLRLTSLAQKKASVGALASDEAARLLYGDAHPWGQPSGGTPQSVASITPQDLTAFHRGYWVPNEAVISVSGDVTPDHIVQLLEQKFAGWKARPIPKLHLPKFPQLGPRDIDALEKGNATQSQVWVLGRLFPARNLTDAIPLRVANMTLGGLFTSRLNMNLREKHGYSYGVSSSVSLLRTGGTFMASGGIVAKNTVDAVSEYEKELVTFANGEVSEAELEAAKEALIRGLPSALETNDAVASAMANIVSLGLPLDYYQTVAAKVGKVSRADVKRVVRKWVKPKEWPILIVGPVQDSKDALQKLGFGPVRMAPAGGAVGAAK